MKIPATYLAHLVALLAGWAPVHLACATEAVPTPRLPRDKLLLFRGPSNDPLEVKTTADWLQRRDEIRRGMEAIMGSLPGQRKGARWTCGSKRKSTAVTTCGD